jgi:transposase
MSLPDFSRQMPLFGVQNLLGAAFEPDDRFRLFAAIVYPRLVAARPALESCYCANNGRPGVEPVLMLGISLLQFMERVPDRQAMEMVKYHLGWRLALQLELDVAAPEASSLTYFRRRLLEHEQARLAFDTVLEGLRAAGLVSRKARQRLDSTHVLGAVAAMGSVECVRETLRLALRELEGVAGLSRPEFWDRLWERYVENKLDYRLEEKALAEKHLAAGRDLAALSAWLEGQGEAVREGKQAALVKRVLGEQFEVVEGVLGKRKDRPSNAVRNPNDPAMEWSTKGKTGTKGWVGSKAQIAETVEDGEREADEPTRSFLVAMETQAATGGEPAGMQQVLESEKASGQEAPPELFVDAGYVSAEALKDAAEEGRELVGPALGSSHQPAGFRTEDFQVDVGQRRAVCPAGQANATCTRVEGREGEAATYKFGWGGACASCPLKGQCVGNKKDHRTLEVGEHHAYLQDRRREQKTEAFQKKMNQRKAIEGTISELTRGYGLRRSRYRGLPKAALQNYLIGAACNAGRWIRRAAWRMRQAARAARAAARAVGAALRPEAPAAAIGG